MIRNRYTRIRRWTTRVAFPYKSSVMLQHDANWDCENKTDNKIEIQISIISYRTNKWQIITKRKLGLNWNRQQWITTWSQSAQLTKCRSYMKKCATNIISETCFLQHIWNYYKRMYKVGQWIIQPSWNYMYISGVRKPHGTNLQDILKSRETWIMQKYRQTNYIRRIYTLRRFITLYLYAKYYQK